MRRIIVVFCVTFLSLSAAGCGQAPTSVSDSSGYIKVSMTLDVVVGADDNFSEGNACFGQGTIASVMYFTPEGGDVVFQNTTLTVSSVPCLKCYSEIRSTTTTFPIELAAKYNPYSVNVSDAQGNPLYMKDELIFWIVVPPTNSLDIYYECDGTPDTLPDYGSAVANIASPFILEQWTQDLVLNEVKVSTREDVTFPPIYKADVTISVIETLVDAIGE